MNKVFRILYLTISLCFISTVFTGAYLADSAIIEKNIYEGSEPVLPTCQNYPGPDYCPGGEGEIIVVGYDQSGCAIYSCRNYSTSVVINEVYYDVDPDFGNEGTDSNPDEWIELYNNTNSPVNLKDWSISDNSTSRSISHANLLIPAKGFAVLAKSASTWSYWDIPDSAQKINLGQKIGNGLSNTGDKLILFNENGVVIDQISYGNNTDVFNPAISIVLEGHSISRNPSGKDSDSILDFIDLISPTPGS